ncbi:probable F-box protein At3g61730 [Impatiens glandulifera]|uniref:probable F-box protein At3g61730 n=1 Tax=Impatiens glandulifera TaxID=253017 RepID=UPI001FB05911|nr:probable F-box protein At3g61730 [Impatiens glandulifera]
MMEKRFEEDIWTEIAKYMEAKSLVMLASTCQWFNKLIKDQSIWKFACLRDLQVPLVGTITHDWLMLYASAFDGSHSYIFSQQDKHIDWMRIGAFVFDSTEALLTDKLILPVNPSKDKIADQMVLENDAFVLKNIKTGIWIADLQLVRCPVCDVDTCDGTMQTLDARHIELFLNEDYQNGSWEYEMIGSNDIKKHSNAACGGIFDMKHITDPSNDVIFDLKKWTGLSKDWQPKAKLTQHAAAVSTNLQDNEGIHVKYHAMRAGAEGEVVSIRISQQLL